MTTRDALPDLTDELNVFLGDLERLPSVERVALSGLLEHEVASLIVKPLEEAAADEHDGRSSSG